MKVPSQQPAVRLHSRNWPWKSMLGCPRELSAIESERQPERCCWKWRDSLESFLARHKNDFPNLEGAFHQSVNDLDGQIESAKADVEMWSDHLAYSRRMEIKGYLSPSQVQADESHLFGSKETLKKLETTKLLLLKFDSQVSVRQASTDVQEAWRAYDKAVSQAEANEAAKESDRKTARSVYLQEADKLKEIEDQLRYCKITAPQDGMVVYYIPESSRWSQTERGLIQQGASVQEGQKMMRIPDLAKMQVSTNVHEAMVRRIRGDVRKTTGVHESVLAGLLLNPSPFNTPVPVHEQLIEQLREEYRSHEYVRSVTRPAGFHSRGRIPRDSLEGPCSQRVADRCRDELDVIRRQGLLDHRRHRRPAPRTETGHERRGNHPRE